METNLKYINQICVDLGGTGGHILNVRGENEICTLLGGTGGHSLEINALNEICTIQGVTAGHSLVLNALNAIAGVTKVTNLEAWKYIQSGSVLNPLPPVILGDGNTVARYDRTIADGAVKDVNGVESIYWDLNVGSSSRGAEESTGTTVAYGIYEITATQTDHFFTGCKVGDIFPAVGGVTIDANNKVKRVTGNHLCNPVASKRPINGLFDGTDDFMKSAPFTYNQPEFIYMIFKQNVQVLDDYIFDGNSNASGSVQMEPPPTDGLRPRAGVIVAERVVLPIGTWGVLRVYFNGASSSIQVNDNTKVTGNWGSANMGVFIIGSRAAAASFFSNIEFAEAILRKSADGEADIYAYLEKKKNKLSVIDNGLKQFDNAKLILTFDDAYANWDTNLTPVLDSKTVKATFYTIGSWVGTGSYISWSRLKAMQDSGQDIQCHTYNHHGLASDGLTNQQILDELTLNASAFTANNLTAPAHTSYPSGDYNENVVAVIKNSGLRLTARAGYSGLLETGLMWKTVNRLILPAKLFTGTIAELSTYTDAIDTAIANKQALCLVGHKVFVNDIEVIDANCVTSALIGAIIDYAQANNVDIITVSQLSDLLPD